MNGEYRGESPIGKLMYDFNCTKAADMNFEQIAEQTMYLKETLNGVQAMCKVLEAMRNEFLKEVVKGMLADGMLTLKKISEYVRLPLEEVRNLKAE